MVNDLCQLEYAKECLDRNVVSRCVWEGVSGRDYHLNW